MEGWIGHPVTLAAITTCGAVLVAIIAAWGGIKSADRKNRFSNIDPDSYQEREIEARTSFMEQLQISLAGAHARCAELERRADAAAARADEAEDKYDAANRAWRHLVNGLVTWVGIVKSLIEELGVAFPPFTGFDRFIKEGGLMEENWYAVMGVGNGDFDPPLPNTIVLVVDDDRAYTRMLGRWIRTQLRQQVHIVSRTKEALPCMRLPQFRVAVLDLFMSDGGRGLDIARQARAEGIAMPILILTGENPDFVSAEVREELQISGVMQKAQDSLDHILEQIRLCVESP